MQVELQWPSADLSPNARVHWARKSRAAKMYRANAAWEAKASGLRRVDAKMLHVSVMFLPPDARSRDTDNMLASIKSGLDGIADVLGVDDSRWRLTIARGEPTKFGRVCIEITKED